MIFKTWGDKKIPKRRPGIPELPKKKSALEGIDPRLKQKALDKLSILREYQLRLSKRGFRNKTKVQREFLEDFNAGALRPEGMSIRHVSRGSLYNWLKCYKKGKIAGLVDHYSGRKKDQSSDEVKYKPLLAPVEMKFAGSPKRRGKAHFVERIKRRWDYPPVECPISLGIFYQMLVPRKTKMLKRAKMLKGKIKHTGKPTIKALNAFVIDCLRGIVFDDHSQIVEFYSKKEFGWFPQTRLVIRSFKG
ncbi:MAG: hypothetical protein ACE144_12480 [Thermodesulfobacteriota bacterium]